MPASAMLQAMEMLADRVDPKTEPLIDSQQEARWRDTIRAGLDRGIMSPDVVEAYAGLHLRTEDGFPIRPAAHHRLWLQLLCDDRIPELLILAPPEAAKTTWVVSAWAGCWLGFFPQEPIIIASATGPIAKRRTGSLRNQTQTVSWQATFRNVRRAEGMMFRMEEFALAPDGIPFAGRIHPSAAAFGVDGSITGARGRIIVGDDIVTRTNAKTAYQRNEVKEFCHSTLFPRLMSDREAQSQGIGRTSTSRKVLIGTPYNPDDIYSDLQDSGRYVVCSTPLLGDQAAYYATVTYPDSWPYETLGDYWAEEERDDDLQPEDLTLKDRVVGILEGAGYNTLNGVSTSRHLAV